MSTAPEVCDEEKASLQKIVSILTGIPLSDLYGKNLNELYQMWNQSLIT